MAKSGQCRDLCWPIKFVKGVMVGSIIAEPELGRRGPFVYGSLVPEGSKSTQYAVVNTGEY